MNLFVACLSVAVLVPLVQAQVPFPGRCPKVTVQQNFEPTNYLGLWYEYKKYFAVFQIGGSCVTASYSDAGNGEIGVVNRQYSTLMRRYTMIMGKAVSRSTTGEAKLAVSFPNTFSSSNGGSNYWVLSTDYTSYSVVWSCTDFVLFNLQFAWVLTRQQVPDEGTIAVADAVFKNNELSLSKLSLTQQKGCKYQ